MPVSIKSPSSIYSVSRRVNILSSRINMYGLSVSVCPSAGFQRSPSSAYLGWLAISNLWVKNGGKPRTITIQSLLSIADNSSIVASSRPRMALLYDELPCFPLVWFMLCWSIVSLPSSFDTYSFVNWSLPPRYIMVSQLPPNSSHPSLYIFFNWERFWRMIWIEISNFLHVASILSISGILPRFANSSSTNRTWTGSLPLYRFMALSYSVSKSCVYIIAARKLYVVSDDGITMKSAVYSSPTSSRWILSVQVRFLTSGSLKYWSFVVVLMSMDCIVFPAACLNSS